jgi:hypothetical protein
VTRLNGDNDKGSGTDAVVEPETGTDAAVEPETGTDEVVEPETGIGIVRLYRKSDDGVLHFREAWFDAGDGAFVVNHGVVGHQSSTDETEAGSEEAAEPLLAAFEAQCRIDGYAVIEPEDQFWVIAQFALKSAEGTERDRFLERKASSAITGYFAWRGLGIVDRSEFRPGKLNIYCLAPDIAKAVAGIKTCIREAKLDFTKLSIGSASFGTPDIVRARHTPRPGGAFEV